MDGLLGSLYLLVSIPCKSIEWNKILGDIWAENLLCVFVFGVQRELFLNHAVSIYFFFLKTEPEIQKDFLMCLQIVKIADFFRLHFNGTKIHRHWV